LSEYKNKKKKALKNPVNLSEIKSNHQLSELPLIKQSRLSELLIANEDTNSLLKMSL